MPVSASSPQPSYAAAPPQQPAYTAVPSQPMAYQAPPPSMPVPAVMQPHTAPPPANCGPLDPGDPRTLAYGTDKGRWLQDQVRSSAGMQANPFRARPQY